MSISCGIVGIPNAGKSTLFNLLTSIQVEIASYPFSTVNPNTGVVPLEDDRLLSLSRALGSSKVTFAYLKVVDVAGLVEGASRGEGLGNQFLAQIREMDLVIHVIGEFNLSGGENNFEQSLLNKARVVNLELILADLATVEKRLESVERKSKSGQKEILAQKELLRRLYLHLNSENPVHSFSRTDWEEETIKELHLLTDKKVIYVLNREEKNLNKEIPEDFAEFIKEEDAPLVEVCARLELELTELEEEEKKEFQQEYQINEDSPRKIVNMCYSRLGLITFFTVKGEEARAWLIGEGTSAVDAAGKIHTDMKKGFRSAEVVPWNDLVEAGSLASAREKGKTRVEGKDYRVEDGDVLFVRFST